MRRGFLFHVKHFSTALDSKQQMFHVKHSRRVARRGQRDGQNDLVLAFAALDPARNADCLQNADGVLHRIIKQPQILDAPLEARFAGGDDLLNGARERFLRVFLGARRQNWLVFCFLRRFRRGSVCGGVCGIACGG